MRTDRVHALERHICQKGSVTMEDLCRHFQVSMNTMRRDVAELVKRGSVEKVYGGVQVRRDTGLMPYDLRRGEHELAKSAIGRRAAEFVQDEDVIFVDSGSTSMHMMDYLTQRRELTVITHNLEAIIRAAPCENINNISLPGQLRRKTNSFTSDETARSLRGYNIRTAFMAATGASAYGVTNSSPQEYEVKKAAMSNCERSILLLTSDKFGVTGLLTFAQLSDFHMIITDQLPALEYQELIRQSGAKLVIASDQDNERA